MSESQDPNLLPPSSQHTGPGSTTTHSTSGGGAPERSKSTKSQSVAVVVPTRNSDRTLEACLQSVRSQTHHSIQLIVVDNHSTDNTRAIAERYADKVATLGPERSAQRNHGARLATSELLCFLDSDLLLSPQVIEEAVQEFATDPSYGALVIPELAFGRGFWAACRSMEKQLYLGDSHVEAARIFRRVAFEHVGGYNEALTGLEDWDLPDRVKAANYRIGRVTSLAHHDEGRLRLKETFAKKRYYGMHSAGHELEPGTRGGRFFLRTALIKRPRLLLARPHLALGLAMLKAVEAAGFVAGALARNHARPMPPEPQSH